MRTGAGWLLKPAAADRVILFQETFITKWSCQQAMRMLKFAMQTLPQSCLSKQKSRFKLIACDCEHVVLRGKAARLVHVSNA